MHEDNSIPEADELLRRALLDDASAVSVSLRIDGLPVSESLTVIFYARPDLGTLQTYLTPGSHHAGHVLGSKELLRVPCDLDLANAEDRDEAERLYGDQARSLRDALVGADMVLSVWRDPLHELMGTDVMIDHSVTLPVRLPAPRLLPTALVAPEARIVVTAVCGAQTLAEGRPRMGIACTQQDLTKVYPLSEDPGRCIEDFLDCSADHARAFAVKLAHQEASVERFLELSDIA
jgi:hypothetical protein